MLNKAEISNWNFETLQWNRADQCHQSNPKRPDYQCKGFASYAVLFVSNTLTEIVFVCLSFDMDNTIKIKSWSHYKS